MRKATDVARELLIALNAPAPVTALGWGESTEHNETVLAQAILAARREMREAAEMAMLRYERGEFSGYQPSMVICQIPIGDALPHAHGTSWAR
jgi:hypothetical protein